MGDRHTADSAGVPWGGRTLPAGGFDGDDGSADPALTAAVGAWSADRERLPDLVAALTTARLLVPVVAVLGEGVEAAHGRADKQADMALVTLTAPDGSRALPAFTSLESLRQWDPDARPVPVEASRAALSAVAEGCDVVVLDPRGPVPVELPRPAVWALAQGRPWLPPHADPEVRAAVDAAAAAADLDDASVEAAPLPPAGLLLHLLVPTDVDPQPLVEALAAQLGASDLLRERVEGLRLSLRATGGAAPGTPSG